MRRSGLSATCALAVRIVQTGRKAYAAGLSSPRWGTRPMIKTVRVILYFLVLAAIGWFGSRLYLDPKFNTAMAPATEIPPPPTEMGPPTAPALAGGYTATVLATATPPAPMAAAPPTPPAKPEPSPDDTATAPAVATTPAPTEAAPPATFADAGDYVERRNGETIVDVPTTRVETSGDKKTRVKVRAPYTKVDVDTKRRRVRIRVPYYNGDIRW